MNRHQVTVRLLMKDKQRLESLASKLNLTCDRLQIKIIDYLLTNQNDYLTRYINRDEYLTKQISQKLSVDEPSVSVRLNLHTHKVLLKLAKKLSTNKASLLRFAYLEVLKDLTILGEEYRDIEF
jgi:predicted DNA-binding protein